VRTFKSLGTSMYMRATCGAPMEISEGAGEVRLPYALALAVGAMVTLALTAGNGQ